MKMLNGQDLASFIKQRQTGQVRALRQSARVEPRLAIIQAKDDPVINTYVRLKQLYGSDIGVEVDVFRPKMTEITELIDKLNSDSKVHGIIVQLPLPDTDKTEEVVNQVSPAKDVDGLGQKAKLDAATPLAIMWLLAGYNIELKNTKILLIGRGRLVGAPLEKMLLASNLDVQVADIDTPDLAAAAIEADIIITATGSPSILRPDMIKNGAVVVDAGVASEDGKMVGDLDPSVYEREDLTLTPQKGGVGPLTVCALFDNVIRAARSQSHE